jgi:hypothetical protein
MKSSCCRRMAWVRVESLVPSVVALDRLASSSVEALVNYPTIILERDEAVVCRAISAFFRQDLPFRRHRTQAAATPINTDGGLLSRGHPIGATGRSDGSRIWRCTFAAGRAHDRWNGATTALLHNAGIGGVNVMVLKRWRPVADIPLGPACAVIRKGPRFLISRAFPCRLPLLAVFLRRIARSMDPSASCLEAAGPRGSFAFFVTCCARRVCRARCVFHDRFSRSQAGMRKPSSGARPDICLSDLPD